MKIDIFSGFLGAGKTTLIKKLIKEAYAGEKIVLIENEFGEIGVDGGFMQDAGIEVTEMNSGCICCSLVGDFSKALERVQQTYAPDRIVIEPSGVGKLSDVIKATKTARLHDATLNAFCTVVDAGKCKMYMKNFGEFFGDQVEHANCIILSHTDNVSEEKLHTALHLLKEKNPHAAFITSSWDSLDGKTILSAMERKNDLHDELHRLEEEAHHHHEHEHHHHEDEHGHGAHEHHHHEDEHGHGSHEHHEHHHEDEHGHGAHEHHEHHHEHHHHNDEHGHHHADDVFTSWGVETAKKFNKDDLIAALKQIGNEERFGKVLRAKGIVDGKEGWLHFDYVPGEPDVREGGAAVTGRLCVIGCDLREEEIKTLFGIN